MSCLRLITEEVGQKESDYFKFNATRKMKLSASFSFLKIFIYLAASGLSCNMWFRIFGCTCEPLVVARGCSSRTRDQTPSPLHRECGVSHWTTREVPSFPSLSEVDSLNISCFIVSSDEKTLFWKNALQLL